MIWILIPAYNEEGSLNRLVHKIAKTMKSNEFVYRIVVVNDGSTDKTGLIASELKRFFPLDIIQHPTNRGLGETERDGFEYIASKAGDEDVIVRVEGDDTHEPNYVIDLISKLNQGYDVINTSRFVEGGGQIGLSTYRRIISRLANLFMKIVFNIDGVKDYSCGYRAYRAIVVKDAVRIYGDNLLQLRGMGFTSTLEILIKLKLLGCKFAEVPFVLRYDQKLSKSKMVSSITTLGYLVMGIIYRWPFGGWLSQYRLLSRVYKADREVAMERFSKCSLEGWNRSL